MSNPKPKIKKFKTRFTETGTRDDILEELPIGVCRSDLKGTIKYVNKFFEEVTGYTRDEIVGKNALKFGLFPDDMRSYVLKRIAARIAGAPSKKWDIQFKCKDETWIWVSLEATIIRKSGIPVGFQIAASDIDERKKAEEALKQKTEQQEVLLSSIPAFVYFKDTESKLVTANKAFTEMVNTPIDQLPGKDAYDLFLKEQAEKFHIDDRKVMKSGKPRMNIEEKFTDAEGKTRWASTSKIPYFDEKVKVAGMVGITLDITERKRAEDVLRESEVKYRTLTDNINIGIYRNTPGSKGKFVEMNPAFIKMFGYKSKEELFALNVSNLYKNPEDRKKFNKKIATDGSVRNKELQLKKKDGIFFIGSVSAVAVKDENGKVKYYDGIVEDITEHKRAEEALRESEQRLQSLFDAMAEGVVLITTDGEIVNANPAAERILGLKRPEIEGRNYVSPEWEIIRTDGSLMPPEEMAGPQAMSEKRLVKDVEMGTIRPDGSISWINVSAAPLINEAGELEGIVGTFADITERKRAEEELRESEEKYRTIFENVSDSITYVNRYGTIISANDKEEIYGRKPEEIIGKRFTELGYFDVKDIPKYLKLLKDIITGKKTLTRMELEIKHKDGHKFPVDMSISLVKKDGKTVGFVCITRDITERKQAEDTLRESEEKYRLLVENVNDGIVISQRDKFIFFNKQFSEMLGYTYDELFMKDYRDVYTEKSVEILMERKRLRDRGEYVPSRYETVFKKNDGTTIDVEANVTIIDYKGDKATFAIIRDITERKRAEEEKKAMQAQLLQSQKLESIGTLASGVAHEINNPLMGMINYAELIRSRIKDDSLKEFSAIIIEEGERVATIVRNLLSFSRQDKERHSPTNIKDIIDASLSLIGAVLRKDQITLIYDIPKDLPIIKCRSQQIEQVIINLLTNTRDSLNERYPYYNEDKIVKISVKLFEKDGVDWIRTTIEDHGVGMQEDVIERIFDPFFTTKPRNIGTGLGLSVSYGLIKEHGGELSVESEPGKYARFHIDLKVNNGWEIGN